jgi:hypothetical protein
MAGQRSWSEGIVTPELTPPNTESSESWLPPHFAATRHIRNCVAIAAIMVKAGLGAPEAVRE